MVKKIKCWWKGEEYYIEGVFPGVRYRRHWSSKMAHIIVDFYLANWKWLWTTIIAIIGLIITL